MDTNVLMQLLSGLFSFLLGLTDQYQGVALGLAIIGGAYVLLMLLQPVVLAVAKLTKTQKDDAFLAKVYDFLTDFGPCFKPVAELFKKRTGWPETAAVSEDTGSRTGDEVK